MEFCGKRPTGGLAVLAALIFWVAPSCALQAAAAPQTPAGSVVGRVTCEGTSLPLRFAEIRLIPKPADEELAAKESAQQLSQAQLHSVSGGTGIDGDFRIDGVPAGDYLVGALMSGYVMPGALSYAGAKEDGLKHLVDSLPTVHVVAGEVSSVDLTLRHGGVIAGRVQFADGSPAVGVEVSWQLAEMDLSIESVRLTWPTVLQQIAQEFDYYTQHRHGATTDDEGRYRAFGLLPGKYILETTIASNFSSAQVSMSDGSGYRAGQGNRVYPDLTVVYGPGVFRRKEAKVVEIRGEGQVANADIKLDPSGLHTVKGRILAGEDRHVPTQAIIHLQEDGRDTGHLAEIEEDGSFRINYLPSGTYTLLVAGAPDMAAAANTIDPPQVLRRYQSAQLPVVVGEEDVVVPDLVLAVLRPGEKEDWP